MVDKILASNRLDPLWEWARAQAESTIREFEMGIEPDVSKLGETKRKLLRLELAKRGYRMSFEPSGECHLIRQKTQMWVA